MKVYLVSIQYIPNITGGGGVVVKELSRELVKAGDDVTVISLGLKDKSEEIIDINDATGVYKVNVKRFFVSDSKKISNPYEGTKEDEFRRFEEFTEKVFEYLKDKKGVIHLHGHYLVPALAKRFKEKGLRNPILVTFSALESVALEKKEIKNDYAINYIKQREEIGLKYCDHAIVNSYKVKNQLKQMYPSSFSEEKIIVIPNYVSNELIYMNTFCDDDRKETMKKYDLIGNSKIIYHLGRIDKIKGIEYLIEAIKIAALKISKNVSVVIAGFLEEKQKPYFNHISSLAKKVMTQYGNIQIKFIPNIILEDKICFLDFCYMFVTPALLEPFGITTLEAWARSKPVIRSDNEGSHFLFNMDDGVVPPFEKKDKGIVVNFDSDRAKNLAAAILYLLEHPEEAKKMGEIGRKAVIEKYSWRKTISIYRRLFQSALS